MISDLVYFFEDCLCPFISDNFSSILSVIAIAVSVFSASYTRKNFRMRKYELEHRKSEDAKAVLRASSTWMKNGDCRIRIINHGKATANNIHIDYDALSSFNITVWDKTQPIMLHNGEYFVFLIDATRSKYANILLNVSWSDRHCSHNEDTLAVSLI